MAFPTCRYLSLTRAAAGVALAAFFATVVARAAEPDTPTLDQVIAKARSVLGTEQKLNGVMTLKISGNIVDDKGETTGAVTLMFKKPKSQRIEVHTSDNITIVRASDGVGAWGMITDKDGQKRMKIYPSPESDDFIYSGIENLYFYRGTRQVLGAELVMDGAADYLGAKCWKVSFKYPRDITFVRYFDAASGELRGTIAPGGIEIREAGKMTVDGVTFPASVQNFDKDGKLLQTLKVTKIEINKPLDNALFASPSPVDLLLGDNKVTVQSAGPPPGATRLTPRGTPVPPQLTPIKPLRIPDLEPLPGNTTPPAESK